MASLTCTVASVLAAAAVLCCFTAAVRYEHDTLTQLYPYTEANGDTRLYLSNDGSTEHPIDTAITFNFFNQTYNRFWINENGVISFGNAVSSYIGQAIPQPPHSDKVIAPFWADIDLNQLNTAPNGAIYYRETFDDVQLERFSEEIKRVFGLQYRIFDASWAAIITWDQVTYRDADSLGLTESLTNTFQCVLVSDNLFTFAIFLYQEINWSLVNGVHAQVGIDANDGANGVMLPDAMTSDILNIQGSYYFRIDADVPSPQECLIDGQLPRLRLTYGRKGNTMQGNAEIRIPGEGWHSICDVGWGDVDATVFCNQLGFPGPAIAKRNDFFEQKRSRRGDLPFAFHRVRCVGNETCITDCVHSPPRDSKCKAGDEAGVICNGAPVNEMKIRLTGARDEHEGNVEIRRDVRLPNYEAGGSDVTESKFGRICDDGWGEMEATILCKTLGHSGGKPTKRSFFTSRNTHLDFATLVHCDGTESTFEECNFRDVSQSCTDGEEAGVVCHGAEHEVRLLDGNQESDFQGTVEIFVGRKYYRVCDDNWGEAEARVVCGDPEIGLPGPATAFSGNHFDSRDRPNLQFLSFRCDPGETKLFDCLKPFAGNDCNSGTAASVVCSPSDPAR